MATSQRTENLQWTQPNPQLQELYYISLLFSLEKSGCWRNVKSDERVVLVSSEPHQPFPGIYHSLLFPEPSLGCSHQQRSFITGKAISGMGLKSPNSFPSVTSIVFGSRGDRPVCLPECLLCFTEYRHAPCITLPIHCMLYTCWGSCHKCAYKPDHDYWVYQFFSF